LFQLVTANSNRRTRSQTGRGAGLLTWPVDVEKNHQSSLITYALTVKDLPTGEWVFSPARSNDAYSSALTHPRRANSTQGTVFIALARLARSRGKSNCRRFGPSSRIV